MKTLEEMRARLEEIRERLAAIHEEAGESPLGEERQGEWDSLDGEYATLKAEVERVEKRIESMRERAVSQPKAVERTTDNRPAPGSRKAEDIYDLDEIRNRAYDSEDYRGLLRDHAMRAVENARFSRVVKREAAQEEVERLLDEVDNDARDLAKRLLVTGSPLYERAFAKTVKALNTNGLSSEEARAMALGTDSAGGFAVPFQLDPSVILTNDGTINPLRQMARIEQITGKEWQGVTSAGITVSRFAEAAEATDDSPTLAQPKVAAERVQGFVPFSIEIDQDWSQFRSEISRMLNDAKEREEASSFVTGTGVSPAANGVVQTLAAGSDVNADAGGAFSAANVYALEEALPPRFRAKGQFLANKAIYNKIRQFDTAGGAQMWERIGAGQPSQLLGYTAREAHEMDSTHASGDRFLLFGDFQHFLIVDRVGMSVELVPHLFGPNNRPTGQRGIYAIWRNNSKILVDGAFRVLKGQA